MNIDSLKRVIFAVNSIKSNKGWFNTLICCTTKILYGNLHCTNCIYLKRGSSICCEIISKEHVQRMCK